MSASIDLKIIIRFSKPTNLDYYPYGTVIKIPASQNNECEYFIQSSKDQQKPKWITSSELFDHIFKGFINRDNFVDQCLNLYNTDIDDYAKISLMLVGIE